jgi:hypothetical protein
VARRLCVPRTFDKGQGEDRFVTDALQTPDSSDRQAGASTGAATSSSSAAQRLQALRRANEIRIGRAQLKKALAAGSVCVAQCQISSAKTVAGLSERQRGELIGRLGA